MLSKLIYELRKIYVYEYIEDSNETQIHCRSVSFGFFDSSFCAVDFIKKHNIDKHVFFIMRSYVFNPKHSGQTEDYLTESLYTYSGELMCSCDTHHFIVNYNEINSSSRTRFIGRKNYIVNKGDIAWYYDAYNSILQKCYVSEIPFNVKQAKKFKNLDWYDDSYLVYNIMPNNEIANSNHQHIISCYMLSREIVEKLIFTEF